MKSKLSIAALVAGGMMVITSGSAQAADLGGDCCADLEERVATLEATTARKGNRKVSLKISGFVNEALSVWDNGVNSDAYVATNTNATTRMRFTGSAKINHDWSAGYNIELQFFTALTSHGTEASDSDIASQPSVRQSHWWLKSKTFGKVSVGQLSPATDDLGFFGQTAVSAIAFQPDAYQGQRINLRNQNGTSGGQTIQSLTVPGGLSYYDQNRINAIRYDTPTIAGFTISAAWGEDDVSDIAIRYAGTLGEFKVKAAAGFKKDGEAATSTEVVIATAGLMHTPTGLFVSGHYAQYEYDSTRLDNEAWQVQAGIQQRWNGLGKTTLFGAYGEFNDGANISMGSSSVERFSLGAVQDIDAAAMKLYVTWDHYETELNGTGFQDLDVVTFGGAIIF